MRTSDDNCLTVSVAEAAKLLGVGRNSAYAAVASGQLPSTRIGSKYRIPLAAIDAMLHTDLAPVFEPSHEPKLRRFTPEEDEIIRTDYANYVNVQETAAKLERSHGTVRQRILHLGLHRAPGVTRLLEWAPEHLKAQLHEMDPDEWVVACHAWRDNEEQTLADARAEERERAHAERMTRADEIASRADITRNDKMNAMRMAGLKLEEIAVRYGLTRERVRQLTDPNYAPSKHQRVSAAQRMARWGERVETERAALVKHAVKELTALWAASPQEARDQFLATLKESN